MKSTPGICVTLSGGLGNQMFQYAAGRSLSIRHEVKLTLDLSFFNRTPQDWTPRSYSLSIFQITAPTIDAPQHLRRSGWRGRIERIAFPTRFKSLKERQFCFDPELWRQAPDNAHLDGYWQSELYFKEVSDTIRSDFNLRDPLSERAEEIANQVRRVKEPIAIHIRRGDYVTNKSAANFHGLCSPEYYKEALTRIREARPGAHCFIFSDDPEWCSQVNLFGPPFTIVRDNSPREDLRLMSLCSHHIIANSSFSWWGAWLATDSGQVVIAPKKWFLDDSIDTSALIPGKWNRI